MKSWKKISLACFFMCLLNVYSGLINNAKATPHNFSQMAIKKRIIIQSINMGIDPHLSLSLVKQESNFDRNAKSYVGAIGLFQLMPRTAADIGVNPYYVNDNIKGGLTYLKMMKNKFGSTELALAAYNAGPGAVSRYRGIPPYRETRNYVRRIMKNYKYYKKNPDQALVKYYLKPTKENKIRCNHASGVKVVRKSKFQESAIVANDKITVTRKKEGFSLAAIFAKIVSFFS